MVFMVTIDLLFNKFNDVVNVISPDQKKKINKQVKPFISQSESTYSAVSHVDNSDNFSDLGDLGFLD